MATRSKTVALAKATAWRRKLTLPKESAAHRRALAWLALPVADCESGVAALAESMKRCYSWRP